MIVAKQLLYEALKEMSSNGQMPTQTQWNKNRSSDYPHSNTIKILMGMSWRELAHFLGLSTSGNGRHGDKQRAMQDRHRERLALERMERGMNTPKPIVTPRDDIDFVNNAFLEETFQPSVKE